MSTILLVDDDAAVLFTLEEVLAARGLETRSARSAEEGLALLDGVDVVLTDLAMPGLDGFAFLDRVRAVDPSLPVVLVTAHGSERVAVEAMRRGAFDYVAKPFDVDELAMTVLRAAEARALRGEARLHAAEHALGQPVIAASAAMRRVVDAATRVAPRDVPVLVLGETGVGKEIVASLLHASSRRASGPLVRFNCAAIPAELAEAELFGHARGAFTGAASARRGLFAAADGGTLVLDEVGELPLAVQGKLLRAVQQGEIQPLGVDRPTRVDVRIVACTHRDLRAEIAAGRFREDLYYRLAVVELRVPPLRDRSEDVAPLARAFAARLGARYGFEDARLDAPLVDALVRRAWPGNVRELENAVARMLALSEDGRVGVEALAWLDGAGAATPASAASGGGTWREQVEAFERGLLERAMAEAGGNQSEAARRLGLSRVTLIDKLKRLGPR